MERSWWWVPGSQQELGTDWECGFQATSVDSVPRVAKTLHAPAARQLELKRRRLELISVEAIDWVRNRAERRVRLRASVFVRLAKLSQGVR